MRVLLQRVTEATVALGGSEIARIGPGLLLLVGIAPDDTEQAARSLAQKVANLRLFPEGGSHFDRSLLDTGLEALVVSQFTLYADTQRGRRPSFEQAAPAGLAEPLVEAFAAHLRALGVPVATGQFGAVMQVALVNDGPVTLLLEA